MTVKELIAELQKYPEGFQVCSLDYCLDEFYSVTVVQTVNDDWGLFVEIATYNGYKRGGSEG